MPQEMKRNEKIAYDFGELLFKGTMMNILRVRMVTDAVSPDRSGQLPARKLSFCQSLMLNWHQTAPVLVQH